MTDVVGGQVAAMFTPHGDFIANYKAGKLRILATSGPKRSQYVPDVPTFAEQGFPELTTEEWFGFYAPAATPKPVIAAANAAINAALKEKSVIDSQAIVGLMPPRLHPRRTGPLAKGRVRQLGPADQEDRLHRRVLIPPAPQVRTDPSPGCRMAKIQENSR